MGSTLLQMLWALVIVIGVILIIFALARKRFGMYTLQQGSIKVVELRHIMPKTTLALIEVRGKEMLLGVGGGQVSLIANISEGKAEKPDFDSLLQEQQ